MERKINPPCMNGFGPNRAHPCGLYKDGICPVMSDFVATIRNNPDVHTGLQLGEYVSGQTAMVVMQIAVDKHCPTK